MNKICFRTYEEGEYIIKEANTTIENLPKFYFKFPKNVKEDLTDRADPFIYALIFYMMCEGGKFEIEGNVSKSVLDNITMFCRVWHEWLPQEYKEIEIIANKIEDDYRPENEKMIIAFSGGLDASYTAYKYKKGLDKYYKYDLNRAVMILGADIPVADKKMFDVAFSKAKKMTDDLGIELIPVETNIRQDDCNWEHCFGTTVAAALNFFSKTYFYGAAASDSFVKSFIIPWGTNPVTDRYLSNDTFRFIVDGYEHTRTDRANIIKGWKVGLKNLRVCWKNKKDLSQNCGHCEKCVRTKLNFLVTGVPYLPSMPKQFEYTDILNDKLASTPLKIYYYREIYEYALKNSSLNPELLQLLKKQITIWEKNLYEKENSFSKKAKRALRNFFGIKSKKDKFQRFVCN